MARQILIVGEEADAIATLRDCFADHEALVVGSLAGVAERGPCDDAEFVFVDIGELELPESAAPWREGLRVLWQASPGAQVVVMGAPEVTRSLVRAVKSGAADYLTYPVMAAEVGLIRKSLVETERVQQELDYLRSRVWPADALATVAEPQSEAMRRVMRQIRRAADSQTTILLTGETGTGKTLLARFIHGLSGRSHRQFIAVHCGAIPETLLESELFGHERGAFTGAVRRKLGKFELADGGTLFLDEIGTMSLAMQVKLLQVLQEHTFERVGGEETLAVDVRVVAATNTDLRAAAAAGQFRSDLFFRLNVFPIELPPLRARREDIPQLVETFVARAGAKNAHHRVTGVHPVVLDALVHYAWPGNVRELESVIQRACILETSSVLTPPSLPAEIFAPTAGSGAVVSARRDPDAPLEPLAEVRKRASELAERQYLTEQLRRHRGRIDATAAASGITSRQLHKLMTRHGLRKESFRGHTGTEGSES